MYYRLVGDAISQTTNILAAEILLDGVVIPNTFIYCENLDVNSAFVQTHIPISNEILLTINAPSQLQMVPRINDVSFTQPVSTINALLPFNPVLVTITIHQIG
ncbi:hypothetical protein BTXL6_11320 [Bacillus thuringiensis]|nr:hypothetical protein BTXL6_28885 [Bacillus thuringiensis]ALL21987.1 hypothetical protein BTXL6_11320 [Bacillus thuringiensis]EEM19247.1 hypothetical protein bthur0001_56390 [Bacillus thuringiensis serovar tochigiensis BGSC 4Y1]